MSSAARPLENISVVSIATNVPGPVAAARLTQLGATVTKVEPPSGDLVARSPDYYAELTAGQEVVTLDLKTEEGGVALEALLSVADVFITSHRPSALARLGLGWNAVHSRHPRLYHVAIVGDPGPGAEVPGHDLTYQAVNGLIFADDGTPRMPSTLIADLAGEAPQRRPWPHCSPGSGPARAATARSPCLWRLSRWQIRCGTASPRRWAPRRRAARLRDLCHQGRLRRLCRVGATLPRQLEELLEASTRDALAAAFGTRTAAEWVDWAREHDLPLEALAPPDGACPRD